MDKYYAIKRPDGSWIMARPNAVDKEAWREAAKEDGRLRDIVTNSPWASTISSACCQGYRCVEVGGFVEVEAARTGENKEQA